MKHLIVILILFTSITAFAQDKAKVYWIDVRTLEEWNMGHLKEAVHIPYEKIGKEIAKVTTDKNADIRVYCKVGGRAGIAKKTLEKLGYKKVTNAGGYKQIMKDRNKKKMKK